MQLPCLARGKELFHHHLWLQATHGLTWAVSPASEREIPTPLPCWTSPSSKLPPAPFILILTKRQREEEPRSILHVANPSLLLHVANLKELLLCSCFHSLLRAREARADSCGLSAEKGICCLLASWGTMSSPLRKADIISSMWHLHSALEHSYVNVRQSGDIVQIL